MFKEERTHSMFEWNMIGDVEKGRPNIGQNVNVGLYRLMQFTLRDYLIQKFDVKTADEVFYEAGKLAGTHFFRKFLDTGYAFNDFIAKITNLLLELKIGILRVEKSDLEKMEFTVTVAEDLDCSGLPVTDETICAYDEGFLEGVFDEYTGAKFHVKEVDCWCSGERVCRFDIKKLS